MKTILIVLTFGVNTDDEYNISYSSDNGVSWTPLEFNVPKTSLEAPGYTVSVPDNATNILVCPVDDSVCNTCADLVIQGIPPTTTTTTLPPTTTTTTTEEPTTTTTTTIAPPEYYIYMSGEAKDSDVLACAGVGTSFALYMDYPAGLGLGSIVYSTAALDTPYDGNNKWYKMSRYGLGDPWFAVQIHALTGVVDDIVTCV